MILPDCMMPDGADPCRGYHELHDEIDRLRAKIEQKSADLTTLALRISERDAEIERLKVLLREAANEIDELGFPSKAATILVALEHKP